MYRIIFRKLKMVPRAGIEPARCCHRGILSPLRLPISPPGLTSGGEDRIRTDIRVICNHLHSLSATSPEFVVADYTSKTT